MTSTSVPAVLNTGGYMPQLSVEVVRKYICPDATVDEAFFFIELCRSQ